MVTVKDLKETDGVSFSSPPSRGRNNNFTHDSSMSTINTFYDAKETHDELEGSTAGSDMFYSLRDVMNDGSVEVSRRKVSSIGTTTSAPLQGVDEEENDTMETFSSPENYRDNNDDDDDECRNKPPSALEDSILQNSFRKDFKTMISSPDFSKEKVSDDERNVIENSRINIHDPYSNAMGDDDTSDDEIDEKSTSEKRNNDNIKNENESENEVYKIVNRDTGERHDIRNISTKEVEGFQLTTQTNSIQESLKLESSGNDQQQPQQHQLNSTSSRKSRFVLLKEKMRTRKYSNRNSTNVSDHSTITEVESVRTKKKKSSESLSTNTTINKASRQSLPSNAVPVKCTNKAAIDSDFHPLLLIQTLNNAHDGPIWCICFNTPSKDLKQQHYLATAGQDGVISLWKIPRKKRPQKGPYKKKASNSESPPRQWNNSLGDQITFIQSTEDEQKPYRRYVGHKKGVVALSWSFSNFLLSASLDKTVRLWHPTKDCCLYVFMHADIVSSVDWHPFDDKYFVSGGCDKKLRVWCIPDGRVIQWHQTPAIITASKYTPNAEYVVAGLNEGQVIFYTTKSGACKYHTQISCKNRHDIKGKKVTGITFLRGASIEDMTVSNSSGRSHEFGSKSRFSMSPKLSKFRPRQNLARGLAVLSPKLIMGSSKMGNMSTHLVKEQMLVTTNDSRLRLYSLNDYCMLRKFKGGKNTQTQIEAHFSASGKSYLTTLHWTFFFNK